MNKQEKEFRALYEKYLVWKTSQQGQRDGYSYEKSFVEFAQGFTKELFELSVAPEEDEVSSKKKSKLV